MSCRSQSNREIRATPHASPAYTELKIGCGFKADLHSVHHRLLVQRATYGKHGSECHILSLDIVLSGQFPHPELSSNRAKPSQEARQLGRRGLVQAQHVDWLSIVAGHEWILCGAKPECLFTKRCLPALNV